ncbi:hypothetical protein [Streptacidiphilus sp. EB129]|uniref:hypothetical protein n=1 Tax=Streptacidiphilus sp. EB129 TaxID=3156262 RepID=UPI0035168443
MTTIARPTSPPEAHTGWLANLYPDLVQAPGDFSTLYRSRSRDFERDTAELVAVVVQCARERGGSAV